MADATAAAAAVATSNDDESSSSSASQRARVKSERSVDATAAAVGVKAEMTAKQLKLLLFQELSRRRPHAHPHVWSQYWRALQQFLLARIAADEFQSLMELLLGDDRDLAELHNAFIVAILAQAADTTTASKASDVVGTQVTSVRGSTPSAHTERNKRARSNSASARDEAADTCS